ncbi:serine/arginine repetitive matrix protein 1-like isoform X1 [Hibiscus syriacus]|uniref:serine/arginine repetitive matrix protein 1-like isoform X1 n=1 Tax=Hibiscus syriacus TaxID=106335 RepID=UPI001923003E|nr:serine/arginine repetitive matrix protein 1-like isoform X1 [Hibiscus syriacus]
MSGGFFRGTSADQDTRFSNKQAKLLKSQKFAPELEHLVDMTKVKMDVIRPWIATRVTELLGFEDEVLINFICGLLDGKEVNGKEVQISLTGFMEKNTRKFMKELWILLLSAQNNASGVPQQFLDAKEEETRKKKEESDRIANEIQQKKDKESRELEQERSRKMAGDAGLDSSSKNMLPKGSSVCPEEEKDTDQRNGVRRKSVSRSPCSTDRLPSPWRPHSRSVSRSFSNSRSYSDGKKKFRSVSRSPQPRQSSISFDKTYPSPRKSPTRSRYSPRSSRSPARRRSPYSRQRSRSHSSRGSPSPVRRRLHSPYQFKSPSPIRRRRSPSPIRRRRSPSPIRRRRSPSPIRRRRSPSPIRRRRSPSPIRRLRSPSPIRRRRSPSPIRRRRSPSPIRRRRSPSPIRRRRSPSPIRRHRSPSPIRRRRSPSPIRRRRSPSLVRHHRSPSDVHRMSRSPVRRKSPPPTHRRSPLPVRHRSPSPFRRRSPSLVRQQRRRSSSTPRHRSSSPARRRSPASSRRPITPSQGKSSPYQSSSASPVQRRSSPVGRFQKDRRSPLLFHGERQRMSGKLSPVSGSPSHLRKQSTSEDRRSSSLRDSPMRQCMQRIARDDSFSPEQKSRELKGQLDSKGRGGKNGASRIRHSPPLSEQRVSPSKVHTLERLTGIQSTELRKDLEMKSERSSGKKVHLGTPDRHRAPALSQDSFQGEKQSSPHLGSGKRSNERSHSRQNNMKDSDKLHKVETSPMSLEKIDHNNNGLDSGSEGSDNHKTKHKKKRKHKRSERCVVTSDDDSSCDSEIEDRKEAKRRKEEKRLRKEEKRRHRNERRRRREERHVEKLKMKGQDINDEDAARRKSHPSFDEEAESEQKKLEIELRIRALESLKAKKGVIG